MIGKIITEGKLTDLKVINNELQGTVAIPGTQYGSLTIYFKEILEDVNVGGTVSFETVKSRYGNYYAKFISVVKGSASAKEAAPAKGPAPTKGPAPAKEAAPTKGPAPAKEAAPAATEKAAPTHAAPARDSDFDFEGARRTGLFVHTGRDVLDAEARDGSAR